MRKKTINALPYKQRSALTYTPHIKSNKKTEEYLPVKYKSSYMSSKYDNVHDEIKKFNHKEDKRKIKKKFKK